MCMLRRTENAKSLDCFAGFTTFPTSEDKYNCNGRPLWTDGGGGGGGVGIITDESLASISLYVFLHLMPVPLPKERIQKECVSPMNKMQYKTNCLIKATV